MRENTIEYMRDKYKRLECISEKRRSVLYKVLDNVSQNTLVEKVLPLDTNMIVYERLHKKPIPNTPAIHDIYKDTDGWHVIEEYLPGETLQDMLDKKGTISENQVKEWALALCQVIKHLHNSDPPIIHRDIKPSNIVISDKRLVLIDFDIAREYKQQQDDDTVHIGTKKYAAPEQYGFSQTDCRSDIYSMGILMQELLAGSMEQNKKSKLSKVISKCTALDPKQRFQSIDEFMLALKRLSSRKRIAIFSVASIILVSVAALIFVQMNSFSSDNHEITLDAQVLSATPTKLTIRFQIVGDNIFYSGGGINKAAVPEFFGNLYEKTAGYSSDPDMEQDYLTFIFTLSDPYDPYQVGDELHAIFPSDCFWYECSPVETTAIVTTITDLGVPPFIVERELISATREDLVMELTVVGDNAFNESMDANISIRYLGPVMERTNKPAIAFSEDAKKMWMTFTASDNTKSFVNGESLRIYFQPSAFQQSPNDETTTRVILTSNIE